ncbi:MAG TPA: pyridoxal-phosphate dependent enzyme, partial [Bdellovibrionales bacterium]|nr:pyridoxal-phosphate dependent enzyme [Bdellovibrionales bacterium]
MKHQRIGLEQIKQAREFLKNTITRTPVRRCPKAFELSGTELFFKLENEQLAGSFKIRGAMNKMNALTAEEKKRGVIASSAGNHAQGVALAATSLGVASHIVMPLTAPIVKINATKNYGAKVILHGDFYDEAYEHAKKLEAEKGYIFVHP